MRANSLSPCITTTRVEESRDCYGKHFGAKITFERGWYVNLEFGKGASLQFMAPQPDQPVCNPAGLTCNFSVSDVDAEFQPRAASGLVAVMPLEDHPWGHRGFAVQDPNGIVLYIHSVREPSAYFRPW